MNSVHSWECTWIPNFGVIAKPLNEATKGSHNEPLTWIGETDDAYRTLKEALTEAPDPGIPSLAKPFELYVPERKGIAVGGPDPKLGMEPLPVAFLRSWRDKLRLPRISEGGSCYYSSSERGPENNHRPTSREILTPHQARPTLEFKSHLQMSR
jgi:hypothetical protein